MSVWATSKFTPGQFLGSTGANVLSAKELQRGGQQAWAKRVSSSSPQSKLKTISRLLLQKNRCFLTGIRKPPVFGSP